MDINILIRQSYFLGADARGGNSQKTIIKRGSNAQTDLSKVKGEFQWNLNKSG